MLLYSSFCFFFGRVSVVNLLDTRRIAKNEKEKLPHMNTREFFCFIESGKQLLYIVAVYKNKSICHNVYQSWIYILRVAINKT